MKNKFSVLLLLFFPLFFFTACHSNKEIKEEVIAEEPVVNDSLMMQLFGFETPHHFSITVPETKGVCTFSSIKQVNDDNILIGNYSDEEEKGTVNLFFKKEGNILIAQQGDTLYMVAPMTVSTQGSGFFTYVGFFVVNGIERTVQMTSSYFVGDRIMLERLHYQDGKLVCGFKTHGPKQAMSEKPAQSSTIELKVDKDGFKS